MSQRAQRASGFVASLNISDAKGTSKTPVPSAELHANSGMSGDAHAGPGPRQVSLLTLDAVRRMRDAGADVAAGSFGENLTVEDIDPSALALGTRLSVGSSAVLVISQHGKVCHDRCAIYYHVGDCVMPREGTFATVERSGIVFAGDPVAILDGKEAG